MNRLPPTNPKIPHSGSVQKSQALSTPLHPPFPTERAIPSLANGEPLGGCAQKKAEKLLKCMAQISDDESDILTKLEAMSDQNLLALDYSPYTSILDAALTLIRPKALQFLMSKWKSSQATTPLHSLSQHAAIHHLTTAMEIYTKHVHSQGHKDFDKPSVSLPITQRMLETILDLFKLKTWEAALLKVLEDNQQTHRFSAEVVTFIQARLNTSSTQSF